MKFFAIFISLVQLLSLSVSSADTHVFSNKQYEIIWHFNYSENVPEAKHQENLNEFMQLAKEKGWNVTVEKQFKQTAVWHSPINKETLADVVVNKLKGCESYNNECKRIIGNLNRRTIEELSQIDIDRDEGLSLPAQYTEYSIKIDAQSHYRVKTEDKKTTAIISSELAKAINPLEESGNALGKTSRFCLGSSCWTFELIVE